VAPALGIKFVGSLALDFEDDELCTRARVGFRDRAGLSSLPVRGPEIGECQFRGEQASVLAALSRADLDCTFRFHDFSPRRMVDVAAIDSERDQ
jgi:hypothetical protein